MIGEAKAPLLETTWCVFVSVFVHLTASPVAIVTDAGVNAVAVILTVLVTAVVAGCEAPASTSAAVATMVRTKLRIEPEPPDLTATVSFPLKRPPNRKVLGTYSSFTPESVLSRAKPRRHRAERGAPIPRRPAWPRARRRRKPPSRCLRQARRLRSRPRAGARASSRPSRRRAG